MAMKNRGIQLRTREYTGPSPHAVAIIGRKSSKIPPEQLILEGRLKDDQIQQAVKLTDQNRDITLKLHWEVNTDKKILHNSINRGVQSKLESRYIELEERRQKLRVLLAGEENVYIQKAHSMKETIEQKQERMRQKALALKEKREAERLAIVDEKLDQQWQNQCEELRSVLSRRHQDQVCAERQHQLNLQAEIERERQAEEAMYAELWERDRLAKAAREERESQDAMQRTANMLQTLQAQRQKNNIMKEAEKEMIMKEADQLKIDRMELSKEIQKRKEDDILAKKKYMTSLQKHMDTQDIAKKRDNQEELALETKILQDVEEEARLELIKEAKLKEQRKSEEDSYHEYLKQQKEIETIREREIERVIQLDVEAMEQKKLEERRRKRDARASYLQEVLTVRSQQVEHRQKERAEEQKDIERERERVNKFVHEHIVHQQAQVEYQKNKSRQYARDLISQQKYTHNLRAKKIELDNVEYEKGLQTEQAYESRLRHTLERPDIQKTHPFRRHVLSKNSSNSNPLIFK